RSVPGLGTFSPGAGPVIAPDGTVYLGTEQGKLIALHADGSLAWSRELAEPLPGAKPSIVASPAVGADGAIYVVGVVKLRDHKGGEPPVIHYIAELHKFTPGGGLSWRVRLPAGELGRGGNAAGPPNIWQSSGTEVVMVSAVFSLGVNRLFAFSTDGVILAEQVVSRDRTTSVGGPEFPFPSLFHLPVPSPADPADRLPANFRLPAPGPAVVEVAGGPPVVIVADQLHDVVGFSFFPGRRFIEVFRAPAPARFVRASRSLLSCGHFAVGTAAMGLGDEGAIVFAGPADVSVSKLKPVPHFSMGAFLATPTRLADNRFVVVETRLGDGAI